jgi:squalene-hopene/tetraprenyl-beta-curcumene cyclase
MTVHAEPSLAPDPFRPAAARRASRSAARLLAAGLSAGLAAALALPCAAQEKPPLAPAPAAAAAGALAKADASLVRGLAWLVAQQHENGSFGQIPGAGAAQKGEAGMSALALRALAKAPPEARAKVPGADAAMEKTAAYIVSLQQEDGAILNPGAGLTTYRTSIAIMALQAMDPKRFAGPIAKGRAYLAATQFHEGNGLEEELAKARKSPYYGGWGYDRTGTKPDADLSNTHFVLEALKETGLSPDDPVWQRAAIFLQRCQNRSESNDLAPAGVTIQNDGGVMYDPALDTTKSEPVKLPDGTAAIPSYASMTYAGLMSFLHANVGKDDPRVKAAFGWIRANYTLDENRGLGSRSNPQAGKQGLFYYFHTFAKGLAAWGEAEIADAQGAKHRWADELAARLAEMQSPEGWWVNEEKRWWEDDKVLCTCYSLLALEIARPWMGEAK